MLRVWTPGNRSGTNHEDALQACLQQGTTTNGKCLLPFKTGAFLAGKPVLPVILKYGPDRVSPAWESIDALWHMFLMLATPTHSITAYEVRCQSNCCTRPAESCKISSYTVLGGPDSLQHVAGPTQMPPQRLDIMPSGTRLLTCSSNKSSTACA